MLLISMRRIKFLMLKCQVLIVVDLPALFDLKNEVNYESIAN